MRSYTLKQEDVMCDRPMRHVDSGVAKPRHTRVRARTSRPSALAIAQRSLVPRVSSRTQTTLA